MRRHLRRDGEASRTDGVDQVPTGAEPPREDERDVQALQAEIVELHAELELERRARAEALEERDAALAASADGEQRIDDLIERRVEDLTARERALRETKERLDAEASARAAEIEELRRELAEANAKVAAAEAGAAEEQPPGEPSGPQADSERPGVLPRILRGRRERRPAPTQRFIERPGKCAVCARGLLVPDETELLMSGWTVRDGAGLCPDCRADGWLWPEDAPLPYRPIGDTRANGPAGDAVRD